MKKKPTFILLVLFIFFIGIFPEPERSDDIPVLKDCVLGQKSNEQHLYIIGGFREREIFADVYAIPVFELTGGKELKWMKIGKMPKALQGHTAIALKNRIFIIGGLEGFSGGRPIYSANAYSAEVKDGQIKNWIESGFIPHPLGYHSSVKFGNNLITSGGQAPDNVSSVYAVSVMEDDKLLNWKVIGNMPKPMRGHASVMIKDRLFLLGGHDDSGFFDQVYSAQLQMDGRIGKWEYTTTLPLPLVHSGVVERNGRIYIFGGQDSGDKLHTGIYSAEVAGSKVGNWRNETPFPVPQSRMTVNVLDNLVIVTGGGFGWEPPVYSAIFTSEFGEEGMLGKWQKIGDLPRPLTFHAAVIVPETQHE